MNLHTEHYVRLTHVVPNLSGGWSVKRSGANRASRNFDTKDRAVSYARDVSRRQGSEVIIHGRDGRIQSHDSHGHNPNPPRYTDAHKSRR
ncbi:MAG: DUF2188 domain-containing protein [Calditrichaeota bacterium]|nr:DUF2188 domain-containing protein [Calditrichota bacterium]